MSKRVNGLQRMAARVSDGLLGWCGEGLAPTEFSAAEQRQPHRGAREHMCGIGH